jgi:hypothetical protein
MNIFEKIAIGIIALITVACVLVIYLNFSNLTAIFP